jgi:hypothetical protein
MIVPALKAVGVLEPAAHMFVFYYAVLPTSPPTASPPSPPPPSPGEPLPTRC